MTMPQPLDTEAMIGLLSCPVTGSGLKRDGNELVSLRGGMRYPIRDGVPVLLREAAVCPEAGQDLDAYERTFDPA